tara:strand:+ start:148 stop:399 length:252 start_codon:yes stop_codon:yes gene_type:complete
MKYDDVEWQAAACKGIDTELFFLKPNEAMALNPQLKKICRNCPIYSECLEYAIWNEWEGVWAATTPTDRRRIRAKLRRRDDAA